MSIREMCSMRAEQWPAIDPKPLRLAFRTVVGVAVAIAATLWIGVAHAGAHVYWVDQGLGSIGRANLDGNGVEPSFIGGAGNLSRAVAVDDQHLYWTDRVSPGTIGRASVDGTGARHDFITNAGDPYAIAVAGGHIYWVNPATGSIGRDNLNGTATNPDFIQGLGQPTGVAVDGNYIYWANSAGHSIGKATLSGAIVDRNFIYDPTDPTASPSALAVDGQHIYWVDEPAGTIGRANLDGTGVDEQLITGASSPTAVAVDGQHVYWANFGSSTIGRATLEGSDVRQSFIADPRTSAILGVAVDAGAAQASPSPSNLTFAQPIGSSGPAQALRITNSGDDTLAIDAARIADGDVGDFRIIGDGCSGESLEPGQTCQLGVSFSPTRVGHSDAKLALASNDPASPLSVPLNGTGYAAGSGQASPSPSSLTFGVEPIGITGPAQKLTITNSGTGGLAIDAARIADGDLGDFQIAADGCSGQTLAPGAACRLDVSFSPTTVGQRGATLALASDDPASPLLVPLQGTGSSGGPGHASPSPSSLAFAARAVGSRAPAKALRITNSGVDDLQIDTARIADGNVGDFRIDLNGCLHKTLASGTSCLLSVSFRPTKIGRRQATLALTSDDPASPLRVALGGSGYVPQPKPGPVGPGPNGPNMLAPGGPSQTRQIRLITCKRTTGGKAHRRCVTRQVSVSDTLALPRRARASLARKGRRYGAGKARGPRVKVNLRRRLVPGRYTLTLRYRLHGHRTKTRTTIAISGDGRGHSRDLDCPCQ
jgi:virginiamycin B lyase